MIPLILRMHGAYLAFVFPVVNTAGITVLAAPLGITVLAAPLGITVLAASSVANICA